MKKLSLPIFLSILLSAVVTIADAQEWTRFRGPNGTGISPAKNIPATWAESDHHWKVELPGVGHSSPVLWGDKIFLMSGDSGVGDTVHHLHRRGQRQNLLAKGVRQFTASLAFT